MNTYYFTFGANHEDRNGHSLGNCFTPIEAEDLDSARQTMFELRADKWSMSYCSLEEAGVERHGLREVSAIHIDTREQRRGELIEAVVSFARNRLQARLSNLDKIKELIAKLPINLISKCREYDGNLDIDNLTRQETVEAMVGLNAGKWRKEANNCHEATLDYYGEVDGVKVRLWAAGAPESCRVVEVEEVIPEQRIIKRKLICTPA